MNLFGMLVLSLVIGIVRRGDLGAIGRQRWRVPVLPVLALVLQIIAFLPDESAPGARPFAALLHGLSYGLMVAFVLANRTIPWMLLAGLGVAANAIAIVANGGFMPVSSAALLSTPGVEIATRGHYNNAMLMAADTRLWFLGDVFKTPEWFPLRRAFSIGDLAIAIGTFAMVQGLMRGRGRARCGGAA